MTRLTPLTALRLAIIGVGMVAGLWGALLLLDVGWDNLLASAKWLVGGVFVSDGVVAPLTIVVCLLGVRLLPAVARRPATVGLVVLGSLTILALPVLGRFGERPDNPTLLDRNYTVGWLVVAAVVLLGVALGTAYLRRTRR